MLVVVFFFSKYLTLKWSFGEITLGEILFPQNSAKEERSQLILNSNATKITISPQANPCYMPKLNMVYVNHKNPDKMVLTWWQLLEYLFMKLEQYRYMHHSHAILTLTYRIRLKWSNKLHASGSSATIARTHNERARGRQEAEKRPTASSRVALRPIDDMAWPGLVSGSVGLRWLCRDSLEYIRLRRMCIFALVSNNMFCCTLPGGQVIAQSDCAERTLSVRVSFCG